MDAQGKRANGFSMIELLMATAIFVVLAGGVFSMLLNSQIRYQSESGLTSAFQQANIVIDQIVRDIHSAGYPPVSAFSSGASAQYYAVAFAWSPNYPPSPCTIGVTCTAPAETELVLETDGGGGTIQWIRYSLQGTTLMRGAMPKQSGDPLSYDWTQYWTPYLDNIVNQTSTGTPAIFTYSDVTGAIATQVSAIREVNIYLIVRSEKKDQQTHQFRTITVTGQAVAFNANN